jgi:dihydrofolate reductase
VCARRVHLRQARTRRPRPSAYSPELDVVALALGCHSAATSGCNHRSNSTDAAVSLSELLANAHVGRTHCGPVARLIFSMIGSLDGYIEDSKGSFLWGRPDAEVCTFVNEQERGVGTYLYGRRMYETMVFWETVRLSKRDPPFVREWAQMWRAAEKVVFSRKLREVSSTRTRIERSFDPKTVRRMKKSAARDISIAGPNLAARALREGLVDEIALYVAPIVVGAGKPWFPKDVRLKLKLIETRHFSSGFVFLRYQPARGRTR